MNHVIGDCSLGEDLRFDIPSNVENGDIIVKDGYLFNATSSTITVYCDSFPQYSFRLPAMSGLEYRSDNYTYTSIPLSVDSGPYLSLNIANVCLFGALLISALLIICRGGAKRA